jgi:hypothetical protein
MLSKRNEKVHVKGVVVTFILLIAVVTRSLKLRAFEVIIPHAVYKLGVVITKISSSENPC